MKNLFWQIVAAKRKGKTSYVAQERCEGKRTLDLGCGFGDFLRYDPEHFVGIEINEEALAYCQAQGYNAQFGSVEKIPFPDGTFERAVALQVIEHLEPTLAHAMLLEVARVLVPGGEFIFSTEMPTQRIWDTFSHIRPYSPRSIEKLVTGKDDHHGQETFVKMQNLSIAGIYYNGLFFKNPLLNMLSQTISNLTPWNRHNYTMILRKVA